VTRPSWIACACACACACCAYRQGRYRDLNIQGEWAGERLALACLEVAIEHVHDDVAPDPVIALHFGNRCDHSVVVDLGAVRVTAGAPREELVLAPHDPRHELAPHSLPARFTGGETIAYEPSGATGRVCVDVSALERGARGRDAIRCFDGTAPPLGGAAGGAQVPAVDGTAPPLGGAAGGAQVPAVDGTAPPFGGAAGGAQVPAVDGTAPPLGGAAGGAQVPAVDGAGTKATP
jgi:hypothetical protein